MKSELLHIATDNRDRVEDFLATYGIRQEALRRRAVSDRLAYLCNELIEIGAEETDTSDQDDLKNHDLDSGLIVIKPETLPFYAQYLYHLEKIGCSVNRVSEVVRPTHSQWMQQYGHLIEANPRVIHSYVTQRSIGVRVVRFLYSESLMQADADDDIDFRFDQNYCGQPVSAQDDSLRASVSYPVLTENGFKDMTGYAEPFNFTEYFNNGAQEPLRTYNGVHIPSDRHEKIKNILTYRDVS